MFIGISYSTDNHHRGTAIKRFSSEKAARAWLAEGAENPYSYPAAANADLPTTQQNWHRTLHSVYEMPRRYRLPKRAVSERMRQTGGSIYAEGEASASAGIYRRDAIRELAVDGSDDTWREAGITVEFKDMQVLGLTSLPSYIQATAGAWQARVDVGDLLVRVSYGQDVEWIIVDAPISESDMASRMIDLMSDWHRQREARYAAAG